MTTVLLMIKRFLLSCASHSFLRLELLRGNGYCVSVSYNTSLFIDICYNASSAIQAASNINRIKYMLKMEKKSFHLSAIYNYNYFLESPTEVLGVLFSFEQKDIIEADQQST